MDLAQHCTLYNRPTFTANIDRSTRREGEDHQQQSYSASFAFSNDTTPSPQVDAMPFNSLSANLFHQSTNSSSSGSKEEARGINEGMERAFQQDQELRHHLSNAESWQGDWQMAASTINSAPLDCSSQGNVMQISKTSSIMTPEDRQNLELNSQEIIEAASSVGQMGDPFVARHGLPPMPSTAGLLSNKKSNLPFCEVAESGHQSMRINNNDSGHLVVNHQQQQSQCPPHSAPATMHAYPPGPIAPLNSPPMTTARNSIFTFRPDCGSGEVGWMIEQQTSRYQASPLLNGKVKFPTRPLMPGVLAKIHNEWLDEYPEPVLPENSLSEDWTGKPLAVKRFPTPQMTFESQHVRTLWQELERRRILEVNDAGLVHRLRQEAMHLLKLETAHRASAGINGLSQEELLESIPDPPEEQINNRVRLLWEQTRKSAIYAVGLLRQAEYCIAQGHLGFTPLNHVRRDPPPSLPPPPQTAESSRSTVISPDVNADVNQLNSRLHGCVKYNEQAEQDGQV